MSTLHSGAASHATFNPAMWANVALGLLHRNAVMPRLVTREYEPIVATQGKSVTIPTRGVAVIQEKTPGTPIVPQAIAGSNITVSLDYHECCDITVEDVQDAQSSVKNMMGYLEDMLAVVANKVDSDLLSVPVSAVPAAQIITSTTGTKTEADILNARRLLNANEIPDLNRNFVTEDYGDLLQIRRYVEADALGKAGRIIEGQCGRVSGFDCFEDPRVEAVAGSAGFYNNLFFWKRSIALVTRPLALPPAGMGVQAYYAEKDGLGIRLLYGYDIGNRGVTLAIDILYGIGVVESKGIILYRV